MFNVEHISKRFGNLQAVNDVSFHVKPGEIVGILGVNGAGKSTTMRMLSGYLPADTGKIEIGGFDMAKNPMQAKQMLGYLPENAPVYGDMTVLDFLMYCGGLRGNRGSTLRAQVEKAMQMTCLNDVKHRRIGVLSKGFTHRTCLAQSLLHDPDGLILDEPTDGLDPVQKLEIQNMIRELGRKKAVLVSTHIMEEVEAVCTRVIVLHHGSVKLDSPIEEVRGDLVDYFLQLAKDSEVEA